MAKNMMAIMTFLCRHTRSDLQLCLLRSDLHIYCSQEVEGSLLAPTWSKLLLPRPDSQTFCSSCWRNSPPELSKNSMRCRFLEPDL